MPSGDMHATHDRVLTVGRYPVNVYGDGIEIDISRDQGGWSRCGHANELEIDLETLEAMVAAVKQEATRS